VAARLGPATAARIRALGIDLGAAVAPAENATSSNGDWADWRFHLEHRLHLDRHSSNDDFELLFSIVPQARSNAADLRRIILDGVDTNGDGITERRFFDLSILPLNLMLGAEVLAYFLPDADYLQPHSTKKADPYGIIRGTTRAHIGAGTPTVIVDQGRILGSHKFSNTLLFNVDFYCPMGCADCYKTRLGTREYVELPSRFPPKVFRHPLLGPLDRFGAGEAVEQARRVVSWMNRDPRGRQVYDVILSGGEPLAMSNAVIRAILDEFRSAERLRVFRICTGALFLGLPIRFDDELLDMLTEFEASTGVRVTIQAHLGNDSMISPEAVIAVDKIRRSGISIYSQVPIKNGINFFVDSIDKTLDKLVELGRRQVAVGIEPYMFIVDMHPSTNAVYVPIEPLMQAWAILVESHDHPGLERPRTLSVLFEGGNIILSGATLFSAHKVVDKLRDMVVYYIPRIGAGERWSARVDEYFRYEEPLMPGLNDDPRSLEVLRRNWSARCDGLQ